MTAVGKFDPEATIAAMTAAMPSGYAQIDWLVRPVLSVAAQQILGPVLDLHSGAHQDDGRFVCDQCGQTVPCPTRRVATGIIADAWKAIGQ